MVMSAPRMLESEKRIVDHRRFEALCRKSDMGDNAGAASDHLSVPRDSLAVILSPD
jgi:hypothetical protein